MKKSVVLLSGGMDSAVVAMIARRQYPQVFALSVRYGQKHTAELAAAARLAGIFKLTEHKVIDVDLGSIGGSALTDAIPIPETGVQNGIPVTYVPARNTILLSLALGWAEVLEADAIFCGVNAVDYSGYPDCRPAFIAAFQELSIVATKAGVEGHAPKILAPLQNMSKADIVLEGVSLGVDFSMTVSCYQADALGRACGRCDACRLRSEGFVHAKIKDPTIYIS